MVLRTRGPYLGLTSGVDTTEIARTSRLVSRLTGYPVSPTRPSSDATLSPTSPESTRTACSRSGRPTRSWTRPRWGLRRTRSCSASTPAATRCNRRWRSWDSRSRARTLNAAFQPLQGDRGPAREHVTALDLEALVTEELREDRLGLSTRMVRRRGLLAAAAARDRRGPRARRGPPERIIHRRRAGRRDLSRHQRGDRKGCSFARVPGGRGDRWPGCARRDLRGARPWRRLGGAGLRLGPGRVHRHPRGGRQGLCPRPLERTAEARGPHGPCRSRGQSRAGRGLIP